MKKEGTAAFALGTARLEVFRRVSVRVRQDNAYIASTHDKRCRSESLILLCGLGSRTSGIHERPDSYVQLILLDSV